MLVAIRWKRKHVISLAVRLLDTWIGSRCGWIHCRTVPTILADFRVSFAFRLEPHWSAKLGDLVLFPEIFVLLRAKTALSAGQFKTIPASFVFNLIGPRGSASIWIFVPETFVCITPRARAQRAARWHKGYSLQQGCWLAVHRGPTDTTVQTNTVTWVLIHKLPD